MENLGFDPVEIEALREEAKMAQRNFVYNNDEPNSEEFIHFFFIGKHEGKDVIYDAALYTLRFEHAGLLYEMAEEEAKKQYPDYEPYELEFDEEGNPLMPENFDPEIEDFKLQVMEDLQENDSVKVQERLNIDPDFEYGVGLEAVLNIEEVTETAVSQFIDSFNAGTLKLDDTLYSFEHDFDEEEEGDDEDEV